jgi:hypothetical protein
MDIQLTITLPDSTYGFSDLINGRPLSDDVKDEILNLIKEDLQFMMEHQKDIEIIKTIGDINPDKEDILAKKLTKYINLKHNQDRCDAFIKGFEYLYNVPINDLKYKSYVILLNDGDAKFKTTDPNKDAILGFGDGFTSAWMHLRKISRMKNKNKIL